MRIPDTLRPPEDPSRGGDAILAFRNGFDPPEHGIRISAQQSVQFESCERNMVDHCEIQFIIEM